MTTPQTAAKPQTPTGPGAPVPPFEQLARSYNFQTLPERGDVLVHLIRQELQRFTSPKRVVDIGCGSGIGFVPRLLPMVREACDELWGIEPDERVQPTPGVFDNFQHALMETAKLPESHFHVMYCYMVMEHVADPAAFLRAVHRALVPGGAFFFLTINGAHYFAKCAGAARAIRLEETVLRIVRGKAAEEYHYPTVYKFNRPRQIDSCAAQTGFLPPEYVFMENRGPAYYLRGPLKPVLWAMQTKRRVFRHPRSLMELIGRIRKPG